MKEAVVAQGPKVTIVDSPIPKPGRNQIVTKVIFSGSNPKDWKLPVWQPDKEPINQGDDISGIVHEVGEEVTEFKPGDRVCAFHEMQSSGGSYAEYAVSWESTTMRLPPHTTFEEGAAIPLAALTAACGLYAKLRLPEPWLPATRPIPLLIYGASSAVGYYAIQLALKSNIHPLICIAGKASAHVEKLIDRSRGDTILDYRAGDEALVKQLREAVQTLPNGGKLEYAYDAVSEKGSYANIGQVLDPHTGRITFVLPGKTYEGLPDGIEKTTTMVGEVHGNPTDLKEFGFVYCRYMAKGLAEGWFRAQPQEVVKGGLGGVQEGLERLRDGKASAVKYIFRIADTEGVAS